MECPDLGFVAALTIPPDLADLGFVQPLREQWISAVANDRNRTIEQRLRALPPGYRVAVSQPQMIQGEDPGQWELRYDFREIPPEQDTFYGLHAAGWSIYGPLPNPALP